MQKYGYGRHRSQWVKDVGMYVRGEMFTNTSGEVAIGLDFKQSEHKLNVKVTEMQHRVALFSTFCSDLDINWCSHWRQLVLSLKVMCSYH